MNLWVYGINPRGHPRLPYLLPTLRPGRLLGRWYRKRRELPMVR
jgi:hypothetical protein